jgi:hypothetical protein
MYVINKAALTAITTPPLNEEIIMGGYHSARDGGGGTFIWVPGSGGPTDDGINIPHDTLAGYFRRLYEGPINVKWFGAKGDGVTDDILSIQKAINFSTESVVRIQGNCLVSGIISIADRSNLTIEFDSNAALFTNKHGWGIFDILRSQNIIIRGGNIRGYGIFVDKNYGNGNGGGEKHYITNVVSGIWGSNRNGDIVMPLRPTFGGGIMGNCGIGILIHDGCTNVLVEDMDISGFNYAGIAVGFRGDSSLTRLNLSRDITLQNNRIHNIYSGGIEVHSCDGVKMNGNYVTDIGHPDTNATDVTIDPGYGLSCAAVSEPAHTALNIVMDKNIVLNCKRKNIDSHASEGVVVTNNILKTSLIQGIALTGNLGTRSRCIIADNILTDCGIADPSIPGRVDAPIGIYSFHENVQIFNNQLYNCGSTYAINTLKDSTLIKNNIIESLSATEKAPLYTGIYVSSGINCIAASNIVRGVFKRGFNFGTGVDCTFDSNVIDLSLAATPEYVIFNNSSVTIGKNKLPVLQRVTGNSLKPPTKLMNFLFTYVSGQANATVDFLSGDDIPFTVVTGGTGTGVVLDIGYNVLTATASYINYNTTRNAGNPQTFTLHSIASSRYITITVSPRDTSNVVLASSSSVMNGTKIFLQVLLGDLI